MAGPVAISEAILAVKKRAESNQEEHERRLREEPEYRAEVERREADERGREQAQQLRRVLESREQLGKIREEKRIPRYAWPFLDAQRAGNTAVVPESAAKALGQVNRFLERTDARWSFLFLAGGPGLGKSVAAARFLDAPWTGEERDPWSLEPKTVTVTREAGGRFYTAEELVKESSFDGEFWTGVRSTPRLVIDDLGVERLDDKGWALANLTALLYHRHADQLPTVITLNITKAAFLARYASHDGGRLQDRLGESAWFVELKGTSLRRRLELEEPSR